MCLKKLFKYIFNCPDRFISIDYSNGKYCSVTGLRYPRSGVIKILDISHKEPEINSRRYDYIIFDDEAETK